MKTRLLVRPIAAAAFAITGSLPPGSAQAQDAGGSHPYVSPWKTPWDYQGARGNGKEQSPIDIRNPEKAALPALRFDYHPGPIQYVVNNGHTIRVNYHAPGSGDFLVFDDMRYQLTQFHFHRPSEEQGNGKGDRMVW